MKKIGLVENSIVSTILICGIFTIPFCAEAVAPGENGMIIICPYVPADMTEIPLCNGQPATCVGTDGHDILWGSDASDVIVAGAGNDVIQGDEGADIICGGDGNDSIFGAKGKDILIGEGGTDWLFGAKGADELFGGDGDFDVLWGGPGFDRLDGGPGEYDVCLKQRGDAKVDESCEAEHPPPGYTHGDEHLLGTGVIGPRQKL
ncbi:MAG: hypothetical protein QNL62_07645 [Gammaproteobacteria bacterium]|nr:hypothetical protein [Gammaproteobacteria bacterium]